MKFLKIAIIGLLAAGLLLPGCGGKSSGASSPQALFEDLKGKNVEDFDDIATYIAPDELPIMTFTMDIMAAFSVGYSPDKTLKTKYEALRKKYNLPVINKGMMMQMNNTEAVAKYAAEKYKGVDHTGFIKDITALLDKSPMKKAKKEKIYAELKDVKITGDTATGVVVDKDGTSNKVIFKKAGGKWYLSLMAMMKGR